MGYHDGPADVDRSVTERVLEAVAAAEDVSALELTPPLSDVVDPDALERLFASTDTADRALGRIQFSYSGYEVTVAGDGSVRVDD